MIYIYTCVNILIVQKASQQVSAESKNYFFNATRMHVTVHY